MIPTHSQDNADGTKDAYDHWARGGAYVKARVSNTTAKYGTQVSEIPVIASNTARLTLSTTLVFILKVMKLKT